MKLYVVHKVAADGEPVEVKEVRASTPEEAASLLVPGRLFRDLRAPLRAKVYSPGPSGVRTNQVSRR